MKGARGMEYGGLRDRVMVMEYGGLRGDRAMEYGG